MYLNKTDNYLLKDLVDLKETTWFNPATTSLAEGLPYVGLTADDVQDARARLERFAPYLAQAFPETAATGGIIESELVAIPAMKARLEQAFARPVSGDLLLRLPKDVSAQVSGESFSGSLKATGVTIEKRRGPGACFTTTYGSGSGRVSLETFSGSAEVRVE